MSTATKHVHIAPVKPNSAGDQQQRFLQRLLPHKEMVRMTQEAKGLFLPYPLLGIVVTVIIMLITGIVTLEVQVANLSTTILLRDADGRARISEIENRLSTMQVYIQNDREKIVRLEAQSDKDTPRRR